ncbi:MAG: hypothetical protein GX977_00330 [Firmicutes bacterium]|nr:hypothetical protein [Bacillota bacterium]
MDVQLQPARDDEIDLREVFMVLWKGKWTIVLLVVAAALAAGIGGRILLTPSYEAVATLLIMPPTYQSAIEPESLALETYRDLALTPSIATRVVEELGLANKKGEPLTAGEILRRVEVEISAPQVRREEIVQKVGILKIKASWKDPDTARDIANTWVGMFMENTAHIRKSESDEVAQVILNQFGSTEEALQVAEEELLEFRSSDSLPLLSQQVELLRSQLGERRKYVLQTQRNLEMKRHQLETTETQLMALENDGEWIGLLTQDVGRLHDHDHPIRKRTIGALKQVLSSETALAKFEDTANISLLQQDLELERARLASYRNRLASLKAELPNRKVRLQALAASLEEQEEKLVMARSLTTDALWLALGSDGQPLEDVTKLRLVDEVINPNYHSVEKMHIDAEIDLETIPQEIQGYEALVSDSVKRVEVLEARLRELLLQRKSLQDQVELSRKLYDSLQGQYVALKQSAAQLGLEVARLEVELELALAELDEFHEIVSSAEKEQLTLQLRQEWLVRNVDALKRTYTVLSDRAENARLAELQATGDVRFISPAVAPRSPSSPNHKLNVAIAVVLAGMVGIGVVFLSNMLKTPISQQ